MVFYGNSCMQGEGGQLHVRRAELSFLSALPRELSLDSFLPSGWVLWDTFPTKAVIHSVGLHHFRSYQRELSPPHLSEDQSLLLSEAHLWVKTFLSLPFLPSLSAGWVLVSSTLTKKPSVGQSWGENAETSLEGDAPAQQHHSSATAGEGLTRHCWLQKRAEPLQQGGTVWEGERL